jgi:hypothetical protein
MVRKKVDNIDKVLNDILENSHTAIVQTKNLSAAEEDKELQNIFEEISTTYGYPHITRVRVEPQDGRPAYYISKEQVDNK